MPLRSHTLAAVAVSAILMAPVSQLSFAAISHAAGNSQSSLALHIAPATATNPCAPSGLTRYTVREFTPSLSFPGGGPFFYVYLLACNGSEVSGISGLECGIQYQGGYSPGGGSFPINVFGWNLCADVQAPTGPWPAPGTSNLLQWAPGNCQRARSEAADPYSVIAVAGYFYVAAYTQSEMRIVPRLDSSQANVLSCDGRVDNLVGYVPGRLGVAGFQAGGYNPCYPGIIPIRSMTWSHIKTQMLP